MSRVATALRAAWCAFWWETTFVRDCRRTRIDGRWYYEAAETRTEIRPRFAACRP